MRRLSDFIGLVLVFFCVFFFGGGDKDLTFLELPRLACRFI